MVEADTSSSRSSRRIAHATRKKALQRGKENTSKSKKEQHRKLSAKTTFPYIAALKPYPVGGGATKNDTRYRISFVVEQAWYSKVPPVLQNAMYPKSRKSFRVGVELR
jgi:hypothetical protein